MYFSTTDISHLELQQNFTISQPIPLMYIRSLNFVTVPLRCHNLLYYSCSLLYYTNYS
jgi:hypothetical protein